ncbi:MAG TPA: CoA-binding protein [Chitinophagales bacterium]|nr:CoA-binding protein [Chitinophagales bacterium]HRK25947.1 CoA-binding protein [Chitinophagales bacterium]
MKKTLVLGASAHAYRYSNMAVHRLLAHGHEVAPVGINEGSIEGRPILIGMPHIEGVDTITIYLSPQHQVQYYPYILQLKPKRLIFNPGAENPELAALAQQNGIETENACTLVLLSVNQY